MVAVVVMAGMVVMADYRQDAGWDGGGERQHGEREHHEP